MFSNNLSKRLLSYLNKQCGCDSLLSLQDHLHSIVTGVRVKIFLIKSDFELNKTFCLNLLRIIISNALVRYFKHRDDFCCIEIACGGCSFPSVLHRPLGHELPNEVSEIVANIN